MMRGTIGRRSLLAGGLALPLAAARAAAEPGDEAYWASVAAQYDVTRDVVQLENGNWGMTPRPVMAEYIRQLARVNRETSYYARRGMPADLAAARTRLAAALGVGADEIAFTRNATEALKGLIGGYARLRAGDAILYADLDYDSMQACCRSLAARTGAAAISIALPEPATYQGLIDAYAAAFDANPQVRLVLLTHLSHRTGLIIPVREIVALARSRGIDAIVDAAHSWGQLDFTLPELGADFVGLNLHKWIGAPLGVGAIYVRKSRLPDILPDIAASEDEVGIDARVHTGTANFAALLTVPAALDFQRGIGGGAREARLRALRDRWVGQMSGLDALQILTPADPRLHCGMTSFRLKGRTSPAANAAIAKRLLDQYGIFTVHRTGVARGACVRVSPALFTSPDDIEKLVAALFGLARY